MASLARDMQDQVDWQAALNSAAAVAVADIRGADAAAISIVHARRQIATDAATDELAENADLLQYEVGEGPCLDAIWTEPFVHGADLAREPRWPRWGPRVVEHTGARSLMAFRLFTRGSTLGALSLYSRAERGFDGEDHLHGLAFALQISIAVAAARQADNLATALANRTVISQAVGILMERFSLSSAVAFAVLTRASSTTHRKLSDIAAELCDTRQLPGAIIPPDETQPVRST